MPIQFADFLCYTSFATSCCLFLIITVLSTSQENPRHKNICDTLPPHISVLIGKSTADAGKWCCAPSPGCCWEVSNYCDGLIVSLILRCMLVEQQKKKELIELLATIFNSRARTLFIFALGILTTYRYPGSPSGQGNTICTPSQHKYNKCNNNSENKVAEAYAAIRY